MPSTAQRRCLRSASASRHVCRSSKFISDIVLNIPFGSTSRKAKVQVTPLLRKLGDLPESPKKRLWREPGRQRPESFLLALLASQRRRDLLELLELERLNPMIAELSQAIDQEVENCPTTQRWVTHPGVGALTALAFVLIIGFGSHAGRPGHRDDVL